MNADTGLLSGIAGEFAFDRPFAAGRRSAGKLLQWQGLRRHGDAATQRPTAAV